MAKHVRNGDAYGDGMFFFTQPVGAGGGYADGMFFFTQPVGAGGGYAGPMMARRGHGFVHPSVARDATYGFTPQVGAGAGILAGGGAAAAAGGGTSASKSKLDEIEKLAKAFGKAQYWYALRTSYLNPSKRTVESFPVINTAGKPEGDMKPRDKSKLSERSKNEIAQEDVKVKDAKKALENKLSALRSGMSQAQKDALAAFVTQARRVGAFDEIFRNNAKYRSYPNSPALYKLMIMDAGLKFAKGERTKDNAVEVVRDYARLSPMSASPTADFERSAFEALASEGYRFPANTPIPLREGYTQGSFPAELNNLRGSLTTARGYANEALKAARATLESAPAQTAGSGSSSGSSSGASGSGSGTGTTSDTGYNTSDPLFVAALENSNKILGLGVGSIAVGADTFSVSTRVGKLGLTEAVLTVGSKVYTLDNPAAYTKIAVPFIQAVTAAMSAGGATTTTDTSTGGGGGTTTTTTTDASSGGGGIVTTTESPIMVSGDTTEKAEASFFEKYKTEILVGGAIAAVILFRKQLGIGGDASSAKE